MWLYIHIAHSKGGIYEVLDTYLDYFFICFMPIINTIGCIYFWIFYSPKRNSKFNCNKFFKIIK